MKKFAETIRASLRLGAVLGALLGLSACGADSKFADDSAVASAQFISGNPPSVTLFTVVNNRSNEGAHSFRNVMICTTA